MGRREKKLVRGGYTESYYPRIVKKPIKRRPRRRPRAKTPAGQQVAEWLRARGHNQRWLAHACDVSPQYVAMILNGRSTPSLLIAKRLQALTGIPATDFVSTRAA